MKAALAFLLVALLAPAAFAAEELSHGQQRAKLRGQRPLFQDPHASLIADVISRAKRRASLGMRPMYHVVRRQEAEQPKVILGVMKMHERVVVDEENRPKSIDAAVSKSVYGINADGSIKKLSETHKRTPSGFLERLRRRIAERRHALQARFMTLVRPIRAAPGSDKQEDAPTKIGKGLRDRFNEWIQCPVMRVAIGIFLVFAFGSSLVGLGYLLALIIFGTGSAAGEEALLPSAGAPQPIPANAQAMRKSQGGKKYGRVSQEEV
jgi:hypothetical protein